MRITENRRNPQLGDLIVNWWEKICDAIFQNNNIQRRIPLIFIICFLLFLSPLLPGQESQVTLNVGVLKLFPPQYSTSDNGQPQGFAVDIIESIAKRANFSIEYIAKENWSELFLALQSGEIDLIPNQGITERRMKDFSFSDPVETFPVHIFTRISYEKLSGIEELNNKKVAVVKTNIGEVLVKEADEAEVQVFDEFENALFDLLSGNSDALISPDPVILSLARQIKVDHQIKSNGPVLIEIKRGISVLQGNEWIIDRINPIIKKFILTKEYKNIYINWNGEPTPFWNIQRAIVAMSIITIVIIFIVLLWKYYSTELIVKKRTKELRFKGCLLENVAEGVITIDLEQKITSWNSGAETLFGYKEKDILDTFFEALCDKPDLFLDPNLKNTEELKSVEFDFKYIHKTRNIFEGLTSITELFDEAQNHIGYIIIIQDITERKQSEEAIRESEATVRNKLRAITEPEGDIGTLELSDIIDAELLQSLMEDFYQITGMFGAVIDISGKVLVSVGWQDICTKFHRCNPETLNNCIESDTILTHGVLEGTSKTYHCKNNMWDIATPLMIGGRHLGNVFMGQYFLEDESPDVAHFRKQARKYGFHEEEYLAALDRVPRFSKETVERGMLFYSKLARIISTLSFSTINQSRLLNEHKQVEENLKVSEDKFRTLYENAPLSYQSLNEDGSYKDINPTCLKTLGYERHEIIGKYYKDFLHPDWQAHFEDNFENFKKRGYVNDIEFKIRHKDGHYLDILLEGCMGYHPDGSVRQTYCVFSDITERKKIEKELLESEEKLHQSQKMEAFGQIAGGMAHDFNNVLSGILSSSELLRLPQNGLNEKSLKYVDIISQASIRASDLIRKLLAFSRKGKIVTKNLDIHQILSDTADILRGTIDKKISISVTEDAQIYNLVGDLSAIESTFINLGINSSQAMPYGGEIRLSTKNIYLNQKYCNSSSFEITPGNFLQIEIKDTGCGIAKENLQKIFEPFYTTKEQGKGTGLGLSAVYGTIQDHHGVIEVYSKVGSGTTFNILLPCSEESIEEEKESPMITGTGTILLVDDEEMNRILNKDLLESLGYKVLLAEDGMEAIKIFSKQYSEIDIVLMDMIMPKMNGSEAFHKMKEVDTQCKVIITSGYTQDENIDILIEYGLAGFINKPYTISDISKLLDDIHDKILN